MCSLEMKPMLDACLCVFCEVGRAEEGGSNVSVAWSDLSYIPVGHTSWIVILLPICVSVGAGEAL